VNTWVESKHRVTLAERGLDFAEAERIFEGNHFTCADDRKAYPEPRFITVGYLGGRFAVVVWTPHGDGRRIISMRHGHEREAARYQDHLD
jgi:uncharacterized protein